MVSTLQSKLFSSLFERRDESDHLTVFDIGPATPETVSFFSQFKCRLIFADLFSEPLPQKADDEEESDEAFQARFTALLNLPAGTQLDICLFWDFLNYLERDSLAAFSAALQPYIHKDTRAHGFGVINSRTTLDNCQYGIQSSDTLSSRPRAEQQLPYYPHPQQELNQALECFNISKGVLMTDGRLEILLRPEG